MIKETGIFVSAEHRAEAENMAREVRETPAVKVGNRWLPDVGLENFQAWLDALAQQYGLPEPAKDADGDTIHYGMDLKGQFTTWEADL